MIDASCGGLLALEGQLQELAQAMGPLAALPQLHTASLNRVRGTAVRLLGLFKWQLSGCTALRVLIVWHARVAAGWEVCADVHTQGTKKAEPRCEISASSRKLMQDLYMVHGSMIHSTEDLAQLTSMLISMLKLDVPPSTVHHHVQEAALTHATWDYDTYERWFCVTFFSAQ